MKLNLAFKASRVRDATLRQPYIFSFLAITALYVGTNLYFNQFYVTLPVFFSFNLAFVIPYILLSLAIGMLVAANLNLIFFKVKMVTAAKKEGGMTVLGIFGGLLGGACPGCFVGVLPTLAGAFGVTLSLSALPFKGFEIQTATLIILLITLYFLTQPNVCKIKAEGRK